MPTIDRRRFLQLTGGASALAMLPTSIARAASVPASRVHGSIEDVEHIVVLMQENRSFDHYFGTLRGVRGFGDPHPATLPSGKSVWHQSDGSREVLPFRPDVDDLGLTFIQDLDHGWVGGHDAFHNGHYDRWVPVKSPTTMAYLRRGDMPFHYALADAFTVCDGYHCSLLGPTDPNRYYMWTGWTGNDGSGGGPVIANDELGYGWTTYPERLEQAGVSWKIYQDIGVGLDAAGYWGWTDDAYIGNYGDNSLLYFNQYRNATPSSPLYQKARTGTNAQAGQGFFEILRADVKANRLPKISWIAAPEAFTEHPNWPVNYGAWYIARVLDALTANHDVWSKTALFITYDENDGFFDHVVPAYANSPTLPGDSTVPTTNEFFAGTAEGGPGDFGLGQRVPMMVVSPWSTGGWVSSETFDHTSIIRFMEKRFGVHEPNITPWRRAVCGDLTSAFDFSRAKSSVPTMPATTSYKPRDDKRHPDYVPVPPDDPSLPTQERGVRPSRALGYRLDTALDASAGTIAVRITNAGRLGAQLQARSATMTGGPFSYTVGAGAALSASWPVTGAYDVSLHGPAGFFRRYAGDVRATDPEVSVELDHAHRSVRLIIANTGAAAVQLTLANAYATPTSQRVDVDAGRTKQIVVDASPTGGWYDLTVAGAIGAAFRQQFAGRLESGQASISDPQLAG